MLHLLALSMAFAHAQDGVDASSDGRAPTVRQPAVIRDFGSEILTAGFGGVYGAFAGGATGYAVTDDTGGTTAGVLLGGAVGAGAGYLVGMRAQPSTDALVLAGTTTAYGTFFGYEAGRWLIPVGATNEAPRIQAAGVLGSVVGLGSGMLLSSRDLDSAHLLHVDAALSVGLVASTAISDRQGLDLMEDRQRRAPIGLLTTTAFGGFALAAPAIGLKEPGLGAIGLDTAQGTWVGLWSPVLFKGSPEDADLWAGARLGAGAGYLLSYGAAAFGDGNPSSVPLQAVGMGLGNALGAGVPLWLGGESVDPQAAVGSMLAGSVLGQAAGAAVSRRYNGKNPDGVVLGAMGAWTVWQSVGWGVYTAGAQDDGLRGAGAGLTLAGAGGLATLAVVPKLDLTPQATTLLASAGAWGSGLSGLTGIASGLNGHQSLGLSLGVGDLAVAGTGVALASGLDPSWGTVARVNGGMAVGGALGALGTVIFVDPANRDTPAAGATVIGSALGLAGALLIPERDHPAEHAALHLPGLPKLPVEASWSVSPWKGEDGSQGAFVSIQGHDRAGTW